MGKETSGDIYSYDARQDCRSLLKDAVCDLLGGASLHPVWRTLGWRDLKAQTHRTVLGPLWSLVGTGMQVTIFGYIYGNLLKSEPAEIYPFITAGLVLWFFISGSILGGLSVFVSGAGVLKERPLPVSFTVFRFVYRLFLELCYKFLLFAIVAVLAGLNPGWSLLYVLPGILLYIINGLWVALLCGVVGARFRDVQQIVAPLMLIAFLATPVLWHQKFISNDLIATFNPFTHYLAIVREPLLGHAPPDGSVLVVLVFTLCGSMAALAAYAWAKNRIVFWL